MIHHFILPLIVVLFAVINRIRGGGIIKNLPGNARYWVLPAVSFSAGLAGVHSHLFGWIGVDIVRAVLDDALFAGCWLAWCLPPWGPWIALGHEPYDFPQTGAIKWFEALIDRVTGGNPYLALGLREAIGLVPVALLFNPLYLLVAPLIVGCYTLGWTVRIRLFKTVDAIAISELCTGAVWGAALVFTTA